MISRFLATVFFGFWALAPLLAQPTQPVRIELEADYYGTTIKVNPLPDSTLLVYERKAGRRISDLTHYFRRYDRHLNQQWIVAAANLPSESFFHNFFADQNLAYYLFPTRRSREFHLVRLTLATGRLQISRHELPAEMTIEELKALDNQVFITVSDYSKIAVLHLDLNTSQLHFLPSMFNVPDAVSDFQADTAARRFEFGLSEAFRNVARVQVKRFSPTGQAISATFIHPQHGKSLISAKISPADSLEKLIIGAFTLRDLRYGQGIFTRQLFTDAPTQFFDFTTFTHFFDYMPQGRKTRVGRRIERYQQRREVLKLRYRLLLHDIIPHPDGFLLVAEAYYPKYRSESIMQSNEFRVFEGYRYTHAIICLFDKSGNLIWDNSLPIKDILNMSIKPIVQACPAPHGAILAYAKDEKIFYKNITPDSATANYLSTLILPYQPDERIDYTEEAQLQHWYGQHFLATGFQKIISRNNNKRYVFFLNKISFQGDQAKAENVILDEGSK